MKLRTLLLTTSCAAATLALPGTAAALNPLEYPDNGATAFSRGGAWLATATDPIAVHYNPAALATQGTGLSIDFNASFERTCFDRRGPGNALTGPQQSTNPDALKTGLVYLPACNERGGFPKTIPALAFTWRASRRIGIGIAIVPPSAYTDAKNAWPEYKSGFSTTTATTVQVPAPYRFLLIDNESVALMPTISVGVEVLPRLRVGAGFISGMAAVAYTKFDQTTTNPKDVGDNSYGNDVRAYLKTQDMFIPGAVASAHWSATDMLDVAIWGRWMDAIRSEGGYLQILSNYFGVKGRNNVCDPNVRPCKSNEANLNQYGDKQIEKFKFRLITPEVRVGVRFHAPRSSARARAIQNAAPSDGAPLPIRDPLHDDVFDVELDASYTVNSSGAVSQVRFPQSASGKAVVAFAPTGFIPPNTDRDFGYKNTIGVRLGGQYNVLSDKLAIMSGGWFETAAADDEYLNTAPVPAMRGGFGGGILLRQKPIDFVIGYQRHLSKEMDNGGNGATHANAGAPVGAGKDASFAIGQPPADLQFRTAQAVNGGRLTHSANVFTLGAVFRF